MSRSKIAALLISILVLSLSAGACTSQGPKEQQRPSESQQKPATEETTLPALENPAPTMETTASREETTQRTNP